MPYSKRTILAEGKTAFGRPSFLMHKSAGKEVAGAGIRETREAYGAIFKESNGTDHGQWFNNLRDAVLKFNERNGTTGIVTDSALAAFQAQINQVTAPAKAQHTPGPWVAVIPDKGDDYISCGPYRVLDTGIGSCAISWDEHVANLKLCAASPEMAEALENALHSLRYAAQVLDAPANSTFRENIAAAENALAKAGRPA